MTLRAVTVLSLFVSWSAFAEDDVQRRAREELERELKQLVGTSPTRVRVDFVSPDEPNYKLEEATFELDGRPLTAPAPNVLAGEGSHPIFSGDVTPGKHKVSARLVFSSSASAVLSDEGGYKWKIGGDASFDVASGLEVQVQVVPARDSNQKDIAKRFTLRMPAAPVMVAKLDDGKMPEPAKRAAVVVADAGAPVGDQKEKAKAAELAAALAAEKAARLEEQRAAAKAEEAARLAEVQRAPAAAPTTVDSAKTPPKPQPAAAAAPTESPRAADPVADAKPAAPNEPVDAGAAVAQRPTPEPAGEDPSLWPWLASGGVALTVIVLALARRRARVPTLRD